MTADSAHTCMTTFPTHNLYLEGTWLQDLRSTVPVTSRATAHRNNTTPAAISPTSTLLRPAENRTQILHKQVHVVLLTVWLTAYFNVIRVMAYTLHCTTVPTGCYCICTPSPFLHSWSYIYIPSGGDIHVYKLWKHPTGMHLEFGCCPWSTQCSLQYSTTQYNTIHYYKHKSIRETIIHLLQLTSALNNSNLSTPLSSAGTHPWGSATSSDDTPRGSHVAGCGVGGCSTETDSAWLRWGALRDENKAHLAIFTFFTFLRCCITDKLISITICCVDSIYTC